MKRNRKPFISAFLAVLLTVVLSAALISCGTAGGPSSAPDSPSQPQTGASSGDSTEVSIPDQQSAEPSAPDASTVPGTSEPAVEPTPDPLDLEAFLRELTENDPGAEPEEICDAILQNAYFKLFRKANTAYGYPGVDGSYEVKGIASSCCITNNMLESALHVFKPKKTEDAERLASELKQHAMPDWNWMEEVYPKAVPDAVLSLALDGKVFFAVYHSDMVPITSCAEKPSDLMEMFHAYVAAHGEKTGCMEMAEYFYPRTDFGGWIPFEVNEGRLTGIGSFENPFELTGFSQGVKLQLMVEPGNFLGYLFKVKEGTDPEAFASTLREKGDPNWQVCATVGNVRTETDGQYVLFMMYDE